MAWRSLRQWFAPWSNTYKYIDIGYWYSDYYLKDPSQRAKEKEISKRKAREVIMCLNTMYSLIGEHI